MKRLLCIWLRNWPIQRLRGHLIANSVERERPIEHPIVLWHQHPRRGRLVVACCDQASAMGVRAGMPIAQASEMARYGGKIFTCQHEPDLDRAALADIATDLQKQITPLVAIEKLDRQTWDGRDLHQPQALLCDITGVDHLFGGESGLIQATQERLQSWGLQGQIAVASNPQTAWALAHYHRSGTVFPIEPGPKDWAIVNSLPVQAMRIPPTTTATLSRLGVLHIGQLLQLPRDGIAVRLGNELVQRISQLLGEVDEPLNIHRPPAEFSANISLEYPSSDIEILKNRLETMINQIREDLVREQLGALQLNCRLTLVDHPALTFDVGFFAPTCDTDHICGLMLRVVEERKLPAPVTDLSITIPLAAPLQTSQTSLFDHDQGTPHSLSRLVDNLSGRLGRESVLGLRKSNNPLPEKAFETTPLTGRSTRIRQTKTRKVAPHQNPAPNDSRHHPLSPSHHDAMRRPLSLLPTPVPLRASTPSNNASLPDEFRLGGKLYRVVRHWGPERIETGWWSGPSIRRDYYRVETNTGDWWWVYQNLHPDPQSEQPHRRHPWMLHGRFS